MDCTEVEELIWFYSEGSLPESSMIQVKEHLQQCSVCSGLHAEIDHALTLLDAEKQVTANPFLITRIIQQMENSRQNKQIFSLNTAIRSFMVTSLAILAGILLGVNMLNHTTRIKQVSVVTESSVQENIDEFLLGDISEEGLEPYFDNVNPEPK